MIFLNCTSEELINSETFLNFVKKLVQWNLEWIDLSECAEKYDNNKFSQKNSNGLEKFETNIKGHKFIFSALPEGDHHIFNLEISYADEQDAIHEIPFLDDEKIKFYLNSLLDKVHNQQLQKYKKMDSVMYDLHSC